MYYLYYDLLYNDGFSVISVRSAKNDKNCQNIETRKHPGGSDSLKNIKFIETLMTIFDEKYSDFRFTYIDSEQFFLVNTNLLLTDF